MAAMASTTAAQRGDQPLHHHPLPTHTCTHSVCVLHMRGGGEEEAAGAS
jgi:hypothetical protein